MPIPIPHNIRRLTLRAESARYAGAVAGTREDLDEELEAAAIEAWELDLD